MKKILSFALFATMFFGGTAAAQQSQSGPGDSVLTLYPNPTRDQVQIRTADASLKLKSIQVFSILGTQVLAFNANSSSVEIDLSRLRSGKYLVQCVLSNGNRQITQVIKQ